MDKATEPYVIHEAEVVSLLERLDKAYENAQKRTNNQMSAKQWDLLISKESNLAGGFFELWKTKEKLAAFFINEAKGSVAAGFDSIASLEKGKKQ